MPFGALLALLQDEARDFQVGEVSDAHKVGDGVVLIHQALSKPVDQAEKPSGPVGCHNPVGGMLAMLRFPGSSASDRETHARHDCGTCASSPMLTNGTKCFGTYIFILHLNPLSFKAELFNTGEPIVLGCATRVWGMPTLHYPKLDDAP